ncbi:MAG: TonB family protein [Candidatus Eisenbacteria bacterium]
MRRRAYTAAAGLAAALLFSPAGTLAGDVQTAPPTLEGRYLADGDATKTITITPLARGVYRVVADQWEGVGLFDGTSYWGVFRHGHQASPPGLAGASGTHRARLGPDGSLAVRGEFTAGRTGSFETVWKPERIATPPGQPALPIPTFEHPVWPRETPPAPNGFPKLGDYVYVEELPEALRKVQPVYPQAARDAGIEGTVLIQALVGEDGLVKDTHVVKSIPGLDESAEASVRQWVFKPARARAKPVAVWVAVPVRFSLR